MTLARILLQLMGFLTLLGLAGVALFYFNQEKLVFFPERLPDNFTFSFPAEFRESNLKLSSGEQINYLIFNPESSKGLILYFHGNAGSLKDWGYAALEIATNTGWGVWIMDYPGFGKSSGHLPKNEKVLIEMGRAFRNEMHRVKPQVPVVLLGRSIGSGIASALAAEKPASALILETPYRSLAKLGREIYPFLPEFLARFDLDNEKWLPSLQSTPLLILHGTADEVIPLQHGEHLSKLTSHTRFVKIPGGGHNNLSAFPEYWSALKNFLSELKP